MHQSPSCAYVHPGRWNSAGYSWSSFETERHWSERARGKKQKDGGHPKGDADSAHCWGVMKQELWGRLEWVYNENQQGDIGLHCYKHQVAMCSSSAQKEFVICVTFYFSLSLALSLRRSPSLSLSPCFLPFLCYFIWSLLPSIHPSRGAAALPCHSWVHCTLPNAWALSGGLEIGSSCLGGGRLVEQSV